MRVILVLLLIAFAAGCQSSADRGVWLTDEDALELAVALANRECLRVYETAPFDSSMYRIEFRDDRWWWGDLDVHGKHGYSARVSFDAYGRDQQVEVYFSTDAVTPVERDRE